MRHAFARAIFFSGDSSTANVLTRRNDDRHTCTARRHERHRRRSAAHRQAFLHHQLGVFLDGFANVTIQPERREYWDHIRRERFPVQLLPLVKESRFFAVKA